VIVKIYHISFYVFVCIFSLEISSFFVKEFSLSSSIFCVIKTYILCELFFIVLKIKVFLSQY
jgi:hypothetical protein